MRIALWNANGLTQHKFKLELFLKQQQIDVMLISETHFIDKNYLKIHGYNIYHTQHPNGKAHGVTGIIIKSSIKHYASIIPERLLSSHKRSDRRLPWYNHHLSSIPPSQTLDC